MDYNAYAQGCVILLGVTLPIVIFTYVEYRKAMRMSKETQEAFERVVKERNEAESKRKSYEWDCHDLMKEKDSVIANERIQVEKLRDQLLSMGADLSTEKDIRIGTRKELERLRLEAQAIKQVSAVLFEELTKAENLMRKWMNEKEVTPEWIEFAIKEQGDRLTLPARLLRVMCATQDREKRIIKKSARLAGRVQLLTKQIQEQEAQKDEMEELHDMLFFLREKDKDLAGTIGVQRRTLNRWLSGRVLPKPHNRAAIRAAYKSYQ